MKSILFYLISSHSNAKASMECWGLLGWGRQQVGELCGQLVVLSQRGGRKMFTVAHMNLCESTRPRP